MVNSLKKKCISLKSAAETELFTTAALVLVISASLCLLPQGVFGGVMHDQGRKESSPVNKETPRPVLLQEKSGSFLLCQTRKKFTSPPASDSYWYALCNKDGRRIELGKRLPNANYVKMSGPFYTEPDARSWVNGNCPSWKCDWNGRCVQGGYNADTCPPGTHRDEGVFGQGSGKCIPNR